MDVSRPLTPGDSRNSCSFCQITGNSGAGAPHGEKPIDGKDLRKQREDEAAVAGKSTRPDSAVAGQKRSFAAFSQAPRLFEMEGQMPNLIARLRPFSPRGTLRSGFLTAEDDPHNKALHSNDPDGKPANMTLEEWNKQQTLKNLRNQKAGPFEPGIYGFKDETTKSCRECGILEIDWKWLDVFHIAVCNSCKEKLPDKYSLLTKTEAKDDYLLTDPELKDEALLPHLEKPNPHKSTWSNMFLYLRCQLEEYAFSEKKWGSADALDAEFARRETDKKKRKENKFKSKLADLKKRTRVEAYQRRGRDGGGKFGDDLGDGRHTHEFGRPVDNPETGLPVKRCAGCGLEVEELDL